MQKTVSSLQIKTHCIDPTLYTRKETINSWWPSDAIWHHGSLSIFAEVMAYCLMAPNHYLDQSWLIISEVLWHSPESNFTAIAQGTILYNELYYYCYAFRNAATHPRGQWVNSDRGAKWDKKRENIFLLRVAEYGSMYTHWRAVVNGEGIVESTTNINGVMHHLRVDSSV